MYVQPNAPRSIGGVLDDGIKLFRGAFSRTWPLCLCMQLLITLPILVFSERFSGIAAGARDPQAVLAAFKSPGVWLTYVWIFIVAIGFHNALILLISRYAAGSPGGFGASVGGGFRLAPRVILVAVLLWLVLLGLGIVLGIASAGLGAAFGRASVAVIVVVGVAVAAYLLGRLFLATVAAVVDDVKATRSIALSWTLVKGQWWRAAAIYGVAILMYLALYAVGALLDLAGIALAGRGTQLSLIYNQIVAILLSTVMGSFLPSMLVSIYRDLKLRKEGADLAGRVEALAAR